MHTSLFHKELPGTISNRRVALGEHCPFYTGSRIRRALTFLKAILFLEPIYLTYSRQNHCELERRKPMKGPCVHWTGPLKSALGATLPIARYCQCNLVNKVYICVLESPAVCFANSCAVSAMEYLVGWETQRSESIRRETQGESQAAGRLKSHNLVH